MKRLLYLLMILPACLFISCNDKSGPSATAQKNLDAMHGVNACFESKDFSKLGDYIAEDAVDHAGPIHLRWRRAGGDGQRIRRFGLDPLQR